MRSVHDDLLDALCERINSQSSVILADFDGSNHEKYLALYRHLQDSDRIIGDCFNDLKRSNLMMKFCALKRHGILKPEHIGELSPETQDRLKTLFAVSQ
jgi:hypothetical protein